MKLIGLTGGIGMGKSTSMGLLLDRNVCVVDTDQIARDLVEPGRPALEEIVAQFGPEVLDSEGRLNRPKLGELVFKQAEARCQLENILHPRIRKHWLALAQAWKESGARIGFVVIPLLFETGAEQYFDAVICVACRPETQMQRLRRRNWEEEHARQRIQSQWAVPRKMDLASHVIWTEGSLEAHAQQVDHLLARF